MIKILFALVGLALSCYADVTESATGISFEDSLKLPGAGSMGRYGSSYEKRRSSTHTCVALD